MPVSLFDRKVYLAVSCVPSGRVTTYSALAEVVGQPHSARAVGQALGRNPHLVTVPCHRVVRARGTLGGYARGSRRKRDLLLREGIPIQGNHITNFSSYTFHV